MWKVAILLAFLAFGSNSFAQTPNLVPRVIFPGEAVGASFWLSSPYIVIARVVNAELSDRGVQATTHGMQLRLLAVDAEIENVIQGLLAKGRMRFYLFVNEPAPDSFTTYIYRPVPGGRYVFFLRRDGDTMRMMADVAPPDVRLFSGVHANLREQKSQSIKPDPGQDILYAALVPSEGSSPKGFAASIPRTEASIRPFVNNRDLALSLRNLLAHPDSDVIAQACLTLATNYLYRDPCLLRLRDTEDSRVRGRVELLMRGRTESTSDLVSQLREAPLSLSSSGRIDDLEGDLELFTLDWAPEVRKQASCLTLHQLFPGSVRLCPN